jgi:hypothetical protein
MHRAEKNKTMGGICKYTLWQISRNALAKYRKSVLEAVVSRKYLKIKYLEEKYFLILIWHLALFSINSNPQQNISHTKNKLYNIHGCHQNSFQGGRQCKIFSLKWRQ